MGKLELKPTQHRYYCNETNYYVDGTKNYGRCEYDTWREFKGEWLGSKDNPLWLDDDYNHVFRFDILEKLDEEDNPTGKFQLWLFFILQRKGIFRPVWIKEITEADMLEINKFLEARWEYMKGQWEEFFKE